MPLLLVVPLGVALLAAGVLRVVASDIVTPALCAIFVPRAASVIRGHDGWLAARLKSLYARRLPHVLDRPRAVMLVSLLAAAVVPTLYLRYGRPGPSPENTRSQLVDPDDHR